MAKQSIKLTEEGKHNLVRFVEVLIEIDQAQKALKTRLNDEPKGFILQGEGTRCSLCERYFYEDMWYDKWGAKCFDCQAAVDQRIVPGLVCRDINNQKHILASELSWRCKIHPQTIKKLTRQGKLKVRAFKGQNGEVWVFLRKENPNLAKIIQQELDMKDNKQPSKEIPHGKVIVKEVNTRAYQGGDSEKAGRRKTSPLTL